MAKLFSKEKDIFVKVINFILLLWLMVAIVITLGVGINIVNEQKVPTYDIYKNEECELNKIPTEEMDKETYNNCYNSYLETKKNSEVMHKANINNILISICNIVIVSLGLHLLNKKH